MKISETGKSGGISKAKAKKTAKTGNASFADSLRKASQSSNTSDAGTVDEVQGVESVESILALQEVGDEPRRGAKQQAVAYGEDLLGRLVELQRNIVLGRVSKDRLAELAQKIRAGRNNVEDAKLNEILDEIELRCEVEIAKLTRRF